MAPEETEMKFNLQNFLSEMRSEAREDNRLIMHKVDSVRVELALHNTRITVVENTRRVLLWLSASLGVAVIGFILDMFKNHLN